jgi:hypothetical protein
MVVCHFGRIATTFKSTHGRRTARRLTVEGTVQLLSAARKRVSALAVGAQFPTGNLQPVGCQHLAILT